MKAQKSKICFQQLHCILFVFDPLCFQKFPLQIAFSHQKCFHVRFHSIELGASIKKGSHFQSKRSCVNVDSTSFATHLSMTHQRQKSMILTVTYLGNQNCLIQCIIAVIRVGNILYVEMKVSLSLLRHGIDTLGFLPCTIMTDQETRKCGKFTITWLQHSARCRQREDARKLAQSLVWYN